MWSWFGGSWSWITANATVFSALCTFGMFVIWFVYLQLLLHNFRMQRRPKIIINRGRGHDVSSLCLISNMSQEAVFIEAIIAQLETSRGSWFADVTDIIDEHGFQRSRSEQDADHVSPLSRVTRQGPLNTGQYMEGGSFGGLLHELARQRDIELDQEYRPVNKDIELQSIELRLIAIFGPEKHPIGARRRFNLRPDEEGRLLLTPEETGSQQLNSRRQRLEIRRWKRALL